MKSPLDRIRQGALFLILVSVLTGDATEEEVLLTAGVQRAKTLITALANDANNVFLSLTCCNLNADLQIIARGESITSEKKLLQAGASRVVLPAVIGARRIATMVTRPHAAELLERVTNREILDVSLDELPVPEASPLINMSAGDAQAHRRHGLLVVAVRQTDGQMLFNPDTRYAFLQGDTLLAMGRPDDIQQFRERFQLG